MRIFEQATATGETSRPRFGIPADFFPLAVLHVRILLVLAILHRHKTHAPVACALLLNTLACSIVRFLSDPKSLKGYPKLKKIVEFMSELCVVALQMAKTLSKWGEILDLVGKGS